MDTKPIILTDHAKQRLVERDITEDQVEKTVRNGRKIISRHGNNRIERYSTVVVFEEKDDIIVVVTVYKSKKSFEQKINSIPLPHEWWKTEDRQDFINQGYLLMEKGFTEDEALQMLSILFKATCGEFGEER